MQTLYAIKQAQGANYLLALDNIADAFLPDLNSMEKQDSNLLESNKQLALAYFEGYYRKTQTDDQTPPSIKKIAISAQQECLAANIFDQKAMFRRMMAEPNVIYNHYLKILLMLTELADESFLADDRRMYDEVSEKLEPIHYPTATFAQNRLILALKENDLLKTELIRREINWDADRGMLRSFFRETVVKDPTFENYCKAPNHTAEEDRKMVWYLFNSLILKTPLTDSYFDDRDFLWTENEDIVKGIIKRTVKSHEENNFGLQELSPTWEDDQYYFEDLFRYVIENESRLEELVAANLQNWDIERVAMTDQVLLKMALAEMLNFPSIPVKVSINEYIDLAKEYSTPKSGQFLNGILDVLSIKLLQEGKIRKSGRGLIDNK